MALVVLLRGVNVGGHRTFRPTVLARRLASLDVVNVGAAGTFVVRRPVARARVRAEFASRLPFETEIMVCEGRELLALTARDFFGRSPAPRDAIRFVSVLSRVPRSVPPLPMSLPPRGPWLLKVLARDGRFVVGLHRRQMRAIGVLGTLDRLFGAPVTTRNWNTITAVARIVEGEDGA